jgi:hypothetical protein
MIQGDFYDVEGAGARDLPRLPASHTDEVLMYTQVGLNVFSPGSVLAGAYQLTCFAGGHAVQDGIHLGYHTNWRPYKSGRGCGWSGDTVCAMAVR